jgi:hypothetical protein
MDHLVAYGDATLKEEASHLDRLGAAAPVS